MIFSFYLHLKPSNCPLQCVKVTGKVRSEPSSNAFSCLSHALNAELNKKFGCLEALNLELNISQVLTGSGSNHGSGPNLGITTCDGFEKSSRSKESVSLLFPVAIKTDAVTLEFHVGWSSFSHYWADQAWL